MKLFVVAWPRYGTIRPLRGTFPARMTLRFVVCFASRTMRLLLCVAVAAVACSVAAGSIPAPIVRAAPSATPVPLPSTLPGDVAKLLATANATAGTAWDRLAFWVDSYGCVDPSVCRGRDTHMVWLVCFQGGARDCCWVAVRLQRRGEFPAGASGRLACSPSPVPCVPWLGGLLPALLPKGGGLAIVQPADRCTRLC